MRQDKVKPVKAVLEVRRYQIRMLLHIEPIIRPKIHIGLHTGTLKRGPNLCRKVLRLFTKSHLLILIPIAERNPPLLIEDSNRSGRNPDRNKKRLTAIIS